jgi:hypothetical protein
MIDFSLYSAPLARFHQVISQAPGSRLAQQPRSGLVFTPVAPGWFNGKTGEEELQKML